LASSSPPSPSLVLLIAVVVVLLLLLAILAFFVLLLLRRGPVLVSRDQIVEHALVELLQDVISEALHEHARVVSTYFKGTHAQERGGGTDLEF
jgi:uncharacterized membrane protein YqiK